MQTREIIGHIEQKFGKKVRSTSSDGSFPFVHVESNSIDDVLRFCQEDAAFKFDYLENLTGVDSGQDITVLYQLYSTVFSHKLNIKVSVERHKAKLKTAYKLWRAALYYELEASEMFGLEFDGHPSPRNLLLPEDWQGHPLRKDYVFPQDYHGVEHRRAPLRKEHQRP